MANDASERTEKWLEKKLGKEVIAVSRLSTGTYRGMTIIESQKGFFVMIEGVQYSSSDIRAVTSYIDHWIEEKRN